MSLFRTPSTKACSSANLPSVSNGPSLCGAGPPQLPHGRVETPLCSLSRLGVLNHSRLEPKSLSLSLGEEHRATRTPRARAHPQFPGVFPPPPYGLFPQGAQLYRKERSRPPPPFDKECQWASGRGRNNRKHLSLSLSLSLSRSLPPHLFFYLSLCLSLTMMRMLPHTTL